MSMVIKTLMDYYSVRGWVIARTMEMETTTHWLRDWWKSKVTAKVMDWNWVTDYHSDSVTHSHLQMGRARLMDSGRAMVSYWGIDSRWARSRPMANQRWDWGIRMRSGKLKLTGRSIRWRCLMDWWMRWG